MRWDGRGSVRRAVAVMAAAATLAAGLVAPAAYAAGGQGNRPGTGGGLAAAQFWQYKDDASGSWGPATSLDSVRAAMSAAGVSILNEGGSYDGPAKAQAALDDARRQCETGFNRRHPDEAGTANCRVVAVGAVAGSAGQGTNGWNGSGTVDRQTWIDSWNRYVAPHQYHYDGKLAYRTSTPFDDDPSMSVDRLMEQSVRSDTTISVIVLDKYQPAPPVVDYDLAVTTDVNEPKDLKAGSTDAVSDTVHARQSQGDAEQVDATVIMHFDGNDYVGAKSVSKTVRITTNGDTASPQFKPADFGWSSWPAGTHWFDVRVAKQGHMKAAVDTADREVSESFRIVAEPPAPPVKTVQEGVSADSMRNTTTITSGTGKGGYVMTFKDTLAPNGVTYKVENMKVTDATDDKDVSGQFTFTWDQAANTVTASRAADKGMMPLDHDWVFTLDVVASLPGISRVHDQATVMWNKTEQSTEAREFPTWQPNPDKSWIRQDTDGSWAAVIDPDETNATGADRNVFLDGDRVASVVNGTLSANLIEAPTKFKLMDDWAKADYLFDADTDGIRVYMADAPSDTASSVYDIVNKGRDVTDLFDISVQGTKATAAMKADALKELQGLAKHRQYTLLIPGTANYANGGGAEQVRADFGKQAGDEVTFCQAPGQESKPGAQLTNAGAQTLNNDTEATNEPWICGYVPPVKKDVVSEASQGGKQESVDGKVVFPGQRVEYQLTTQPRIPGTLAYRIESVSVTDEYSEWLLPDKQTLEVTDLTVGKSVSKKDYQTVWDDATHTFTLDFDPSWVAANWKVGTNPRILVRFEGTVSGQAPTDTQVDNEWMLRLNNTLTPSNKVFNVPPDIEPAKRETPADPSISIDGKTMLLGDKTYYRITLDAANIAEDDLAYQVQRLGIVDDYDEEYLTADEQGVQVLNAAGQDVTDRFNIQFKDGVAYVFARTVDTQIPATGETLKGDPQPADLAEYATRTLDPLKDAYIDQSLLGQKYQVVLPMTVTKVTDGYVVENQAAQVTNERRDETNVVANPLAEINPAKDVVVNMGDESANGKSIYLNHTFLYQLDSSILPPDRAYPEVTDWKIVDPLDPTYDRYTGQWAVYTTRDLVDGDTVLAARGERIAGSGVDSTGFGGDLFDLVEAPDGTVTVSATQRYLDLVSAATDAEIGWRAYLQCDRISTGERIENTFTETINGTDRPSNEVWTKTPDLTPSIDVEKFDIASGEETGDRDRPTEALRMGGDPTRIGIKVTNTSRTDKDGQGADLTHLKLDDRLLAGSGELVDIQYPKGWDTLVLKPGESVTLEATLKGVKAGDKHTDRVTVTADPIVDCPIVDSDPFDGEPGKAQAGPCYDTAVKDTDDWNGYRANPLASTGAGIAAAVAAVAVLAGLGGMLLAVRRRRTAADADGVDGGEPVAQ